MVISGSFETPAPRNRAERRAAARRAGRKGVSIVGGASIIAGSLALVGVSPAGAASYEVTNGLDSGDGSLRDAIADANASEGVADTITFAPDVTLIELSSGQIEITDDLTIQGPGSGSLTIQPVDNGDYNDYERLFYIDEAGAVVISGATIQDFDAEYYSGGAIRSTVTDLTLRDVTLSGNAGGDGGALRFDGDSYVCTETEDYLYNDILYTECVAGFYNGFDLTVEDSRFEENLAEGGGAAISLRAESYDGNLEDVLDAGGVVEITNTTFVDNIAAGGMGADGGAMSAQLDAGASVTISGSTFERNQAEDEASGGAVYADLYGDATLEIFNSTFDDNDAGEYGGALVLYADPGGVVTIEGSQITGNVGAGGGGGIFVDDEEADDPEDRFTLTIRDSTISGNHAGEVDVNGDPTSHEYGGGLRLSVAGVVSIVDSTLEDNTAGHGGAVYGRLEGDAEVDITGSTLADNHANYVDGGEGGGGGDFESADEGGGEDASGQGGSLWLSLSSYASLDISGSILSGSTAGEEGGALRARLTGDSSLDVTNTTIDDNEAAYAGGAHLDISDYATARIEGSTISNNRTTDGSGGGLFLDASGIQDQTPFEIVSSTISGNEATEHGGGIFATQDADTAISHSTITDNTAVTAGGGVRAQSLTGFEPTAGSQVALSHTIVSGNDASEAGTDDVSVYDEHDPEDEVTDPAGITATWSLVGDAGDTEIVDGDDGNVIDADPMLGDLAANGGDAQGDDDERVGWTHVPESGSPAIDAGDPEIGDDAPDEDQRGDDRIVDVIDIGSVETEAAAAGGGGFDTPTTTVPPSQPVVERTQVPPTGTARVVVETPSGRVSVQVTGVTPGEEVVVTVREVPAADAGVDTRGFQVNGTMYEVEVTGSDGGTVCFPFDASAASGSPTIIHFLANGEREALETTMSGDEVCATTGSFSPFAVVSLDTARLAGVDAAETAAAISAATYEPGVPVVYVASRTAVPDAVAAGVAGAPLLLVHRDAVPGSTAAELARLAAGRVVVVGGSSAVNDEVVAALGATRIAGVDRYETAALLAQDRFPAGAPVVYVANGSSTPDGLVAAAAASRAGGAVLLVERDAVPAATAAALAALAPAQVVVVGGTAAVSEAIAEALGATRVAGADRYATAAAVAAASGGEDVIVTRGDDPVDALTGATLGLPLVLVSTTGVSSSTRQALTALAPRTITVLGGTAAVSLQTEVDLAGFLADDE